MMLLLRLAAVATGGVLLGLLATGVTPFSGAWFWAFLGLLLGVFFLSLDPRQRDWRYRKENLPRWRRW
jgi:hypothetical protein